VTTLKPQPARDFLDVAVPNCLRRTQGRETFAVGDSLIVKRTLERPRPGLWPWFRSRSPGQVEFEALRALEASGVRVPRGIDWAVDKRERDRVSVCVMERVPHAQTVRSFLERASQAEQREVSRRLLDLVARFHGAGFIHRDLYLQHVLVRSSDGELVLIDVGRARRSVRWRSRWYVKDLASLLHSTPTCVSEREKLRFLAAWLDVRRIKSRNARRRWARTIQRKALRIAVHVPKDERMVTR